MAAMIKILPYDPGKSPKKVNQQQQHIDHHFAAKLFNSLILSIRHRQSYQINNNNGQSKNFSDKDGEQGLSKAVAAFYIFFQIFVHYCLECVKKLATTVHIIHIRSLEDVEKGQSDFIVKKSATKKSIDTEITTTSNIKGQLIFSNQKLTGGTKIEREYDFYYFRQISLGIKPCVESSYHTIIFEVSNAGLTHLAKDISFELRNRYEFGNYDNKKIDNGEILACCELQWSIPTKYRSAYWPEMMIKNDMDQLMRVNNQLIYDKLCSEFLGIRRASRGGKVEEVTCQAGGSYLGVRRHFYPELIDLVHTETKSEHEPFWKFDPVSMAVNVNWPVMGDFGTTTVVVANFISLKF